MLRFFALAAALGIATLFGASADAKPISTWGAICSSQPNQLDCCIRMLNACRKGCEERGDCRPYACEGLYNRCLQRRAQGPTTGVNAGGNKPPAASRRP